MGMKNKDGYYFQDEGMPESVFKLLGIIPYRIQAEAYDAGERR